MAGALTAAGQTLHWSDITVAGAFMVGLFLGIVIVLGVARFGARLIDRYIEHRFFRDDGGPGASPGPPSGR